MKSPVWCKCIKYITTWELFCAKGVKHNRRKKGYQKRLSSFPERSLFSGFGVGEAYLRADNNLWSWFFGFLGERVQRHVVILDTSECFTRCLCLGTPSPDSSRGLYANLPSTSCRNLTFVSCACKAVERNALYSILRAPHMHYCNIFRRVARKLFYTCRNCCALPFPGS